MCARRPVFSLWGTRSSLGRLCPKVESNPRSAEGAKYDSQGQAPSKRGASPLGLMRNDWEALKERNKSACYFALSVLSSIYFFEPGATRLACSALAPGCHISRLWRCAGLNSDFLCKSLCGP